MEARGFPRNGGPTGVMRYEHDLGRGHVRVAVVNLAVLAARGGADDRRETAPNALQ